MSWKEKKGTPNSHVFRFTNEASALSGFAKWDGCVELKVHYNGHDVNIDHDENDVDGIHTCNLRKLIEDLQDLEKLCKDSLDFEEWDY